MTNQPANTLQLFLSGKSLINPR